MIDARYSVPRWIGKEPHYARILPKDLTPTNRQFLVASIINSIELLLSWKTSERKITLFLFEAMKLKKLPLCSIEDLPSWIVLSKLTIPTLFEFKRLLLDEIEKLLILVVDSDLW